MVTNTPRSSGSQAVIDVSERNFQAEIIERSRDTPVVIDFWAPWCGPCRTLGPTLEKLAREANGAWVLAKVNVDENQRLAQAFRVQGIPAVKMVYEGQLVGEFSGAVPETQVRAWLQEFLPASLATEDEQDELAAIGALERTDPDEAAARYRVLLGSEPTNDAALFGLGRLQLMRGEHEATALLNEVPADSPLHSRAQGLLPLAALFAAAPPASPEALEAQVASEPQNLEARYQLAAAYARAERYPAAMEQLLAIVQRNRAFREDGARVALLGLFAAAGDDEQFVAEYRRKLANTLF